MSGSSVACSCRAFGDVPLDKLGNSHLLGMLAALDADNARIEAARASEDPQVRRTVAGLRTASPPSKRRYLAVLASALAEAMAPPHPLITSNVAAAIKIGKWGRVRAKLWTAERERAWRDQYKASWQRSTSRPARPLSRCGATPLRGQAR
jgi:hypothetical protein